MDKPWKPRRFRFSWKFNNLNRQADPQALGLRAYTVLAGEKAQQALVSAREAFADNKNAQTAFTTATKALKLE